MTTRKRWTFAVLAVLIGTSGSLAALLAADLYAHRKFEASAGLNVRGYRGPVVGRKQTGERRIVVMGGSTAFGYGVHWNEAFPRVLEQLLNQQPNRSGSKVSVVNLAYNNEGAYSFRFTLEDYEYLDYDAALLYEGYNSLSDKNRSVYRHDSAVFRLTGYFPMLPLVMREKAMVIRYGGRLEDAYRGEKTVFRPTLAQRTTASALEAAAGISASLERQLSRAVPKSDVRQTAMSQITCGKWPNYCAEMHIAVKFLLDRGKGALVVTQPYLVDDHRGQQREMVTFISKTFGDHPRLRFANLGLAVSLKDPTLSYDGMHLTVVGNRLIAERLVEPVRDLLR